VHAPCTNCATLLKPDVDPQGRSSSRKRVLNFMPTRASLTWTAWPENGYFCTTHDHTIPTYRPAASSAPKPSALSKLADSLDDRFRQASDLLLRPAGAVIVTASAKSGHYRQKAYAGRRLPAPARPRNSSIPPRRATGGFGIITADDVVLCGSRNWARH